MNLDNSQWAVIRSSFIDEAMFNDFVNHQRAMIEKEFSRLQLEITQRFLSNENDLFEIRVGF